MWGWVLPFIIPLAVASTLAYALDGALVVSAAAATAATNITDTTPATADVCTSTMMYVGLNSYVPVRSPYSCGSSEPDHH